MKWWIAPTAVLWLVCQIIFPTSADAPLFLPVVMAAQTGHSTIPAPTSTPTPAITPTATLSPAVTPAAPTDYTYRVVDAFPHDRRAFTQGLAFADGILYEGTGLRGRSSLRKVELETGAVLQIRELPEPFFGEGITILDGRIIQLTWLSNVGFVYDQESFELLGEFGYPTEGWGITHDGQRLIMSDGSAILRFLDPETFQETGSVEVFDPNGPVARLNELEAIHGQVYANVWQTDRIAIIAPDSGQVTGWIDLAGLLSPEDQTEPVDVLNGIAYDVENDRLFVTGKLWPRLFQIELIRLPQKQGVIPTQGGGHVTPKWLRTKRLTDPPLLDRLPAPGLPGRLQP